LSVGIPQKYMKMPYFPFDGQMLAVLHSWDGKSDPFKVKDGSKKITLVMALLSQQSDYRNL